MKIIKKSSCIIVADGSAIVGSFAGPDAERHAEIFVAAVDPAKPPQDERYVHEYTKLPHPGDFGIPKGHWWQAKQYFDAMLSAEPAQPVAQGEPIGWLKPNESYAPNAFRWERTDTHTRPVFSTTPQPVAAEVAPEWDGWCDAHRFLADIEIAQGGRNGPTIRLGGQLQKLRAQITEEKSADLQDAQRYRFLRMDAGIRNERPFIAISSAGGISQWTGIFADKKIDNAMAGTGSDESAKEDK